MIIIESAYWYLTFKCNLSCRHCLLNSSPSRDDTRDLTFEEKARLIEEFKNVGITSLRLTGGEPLFKQDTDLILRMIYENGISYFLETNGTILSKKTLESLIDTSDLIDNICISLDGPDKPSHESIRGKNTFHVTLKNIERLSSHGLPVQISTTVHAGNYKRVKDIVNLAEHLSAKSVYFRFLSDWGRAKENDMGSQMDVPLYIKIIRDISALSKKKRENLSIYLGSPPGIIPNNILVNIEKLCYGCDFPVIGVLPDGRISFCGLASYYTTMVLGNFRKERIKDIWENDDTVQRLRNFGSDDLEGVCGMCIFRHQCRGSCRIDAYALFNSFLGPYPLCEKFYQEGKFPKSHLE